MVTSPVRLIDFACVCFESEVTEGGLQSQNDEAEPGYGIHLWSQPRGGGGRAKGEQQVPDLGPRR